METLNEKKNYRTTFWNLFGIGFLVNIISIFAQNDAISLLALFAVPVLLFFWMKNFNDAWKSVGKKYGWAVGLVTLVPFGPLIAIVIARYYLKGSDAWRGEFKSFKLQ